MIAGLDWYVVFACVVTIFVGSAVQASVGIGMGMIAAPLLAIADPDFIPGSLVLSVFALTIPVTWTERHHIEFAGVATALLGRLPGVIVGAAVAVALSDDVLAILVAASVLAAVLLSVRGRRFQATPAKLAVAGAASGFAATTTGVGGPPVALTYQHADPAVMRGSLSAFFFVGSIMSVAALVLVGELGRRGFELALVLLPGVLLGVAVAHAGRRLLRPEVVRPTVLTICALSSVVLLITAVS